MFVLTCSNNHLILGVNNSNLPTIVTIIVDAFRLNAFADDAAGAAVKQRLVNILRQLHVSIDTTSNSHMQMFGF